MTVAEITAGKTLPHAMIAGTSKGFSSKPDEILDSVDTKMAEDHPTSQAIKDRLKELGWTQQRFGIYLELHKTTMTKWWLVGLPTYALRIIELLERHHVSESWKGGKAKAAPTHDDAMKAMSKALSALVEDATKAGWSRPEIAAVLKTAAERIEAPQF